MTAEPEPAPQRPSDPKCGHQVALGPRQRTSVEPGSARNAPEGAGPQDVPADAASWASPRRSGAAVALGLGLVVGGLLLWRAGVLDPSHARSLVAGAGALGPLVFAVLYAAATLLPVPKNLLSVLAGALFGLASGVLLVWLAAMAGALLAFAIGRRVDPGALPGVSRANRQRVQDVLDRHGVPAVVSVRLLPVAPFTVVNYVAGVSGVGVRAYAVGTGLGILPGTLLYVAAGTFALGAPSVALWGGFAVAALLVVGVFGVGRLRRPDGGA